MRVYICFSFVLFFFGQKITVMLHALTYFFLHSAFFCLIIEQRREIQ